MLKWYAPMATPYDLMMRVSHHYYRSHLSMAEIGNRSVFRGIALVELLKAAVATGMVNIEIRAPTGENLDLRKALEKTFKLKAALIVDVPPDISPDQIKQMTCRAAVPFLKDMLSAHRTIGVRMGKHDIRTDQCARTFRSLEHESGANHRRQQKAVDAVRLPRSHASPCAEASCAAHPAACARNCG